MPEAKWIERMGSIRFAFSYQTLFFYKHMYVYKVMKAG